VVPAHVDDRAARLLPAHDLADRVRAGDRSLQVDGEQQVELAFPLPGRSLAGEDIRAGVVDPDVDPAELLARLGDQALAPVARREVGLPDAGADRVGDLARPVGRRAMREQYDGSLGGVRLRDRASDPAARPRDDGVQTQ